MIFPGLTSTSYVSDEYACPIKTPPSSAIQSYNASPVYQIIPLSSDYRTSDAATVLNSASDLAISAGGTSCGDGTAVVGGKGTFYAGIIDQAQAQLVASARPNTQNVMIILSDGDATATSAQMGTGSTSYPATQECHQAITEAQKAASAGTTVYTVAYGAEASGCTTDTKPTITPCQTMEQMASSTSNFFSDYTATGGTSSCISASRPTSNLNQIFQEIAADFTVARLIPNNSR
jgi:von Willebrand factor type A domain